MPWTPQVPVPEKPYSSSLQRHTAFSVNEKISLKRWKAYSKNIKIQGRGGTDFRPVFAYVAEQKEKKEIRNLKALIYFTDGDGIYPKCRPDYETAFVFLKGGNGMDRVPCWAMKLVVSH